MLVPAIVIAFGVTVIMVLALRPMATSVGLVDRPGGRKQHIGAVPITGGIAMFVGLIVSSALAPAGVPSIAILTAIGLLVLVGVLDDRFTSPAAVRLGAQLVAVLLLFFGAELQVTSLGNVFGLGEVQLGVASLLFTALIAVSVINAFNLVDGADGLAGSMGVLALGPVAVIAGYSSSAGLLATVSIAVILGFLCFNFPTIYNRRVRTFMGDAGSTMIGLLVVVCIARVTQGQNGVVSPAVGLWFAALPIFDLFTCFVRRIRRGVSPFQPGRDHFHHVLSRGGLGVRQTLGILTLMQVTYVTFGLVGHYLGIADAAIFGAWAIVGGTQWWFIRKFAAVARGGRRRRQATSDQAAADKPRRAA